MSMLRSLFVAALALPLGAQDPVGEPAFVRIRVVGAKDGLPRPGVPLHRRQLTNVTATDPDGFVRAEDPHITALRTATASWRTDPAGEAMLPAELATRTYLLFAGEPFTLGEMTKADDGTLVWKAYDREPVGVVAVDGQGAAVPFLPVALRVGSKEVAFAITDKRGAAVLGVPADATARMCIAPAGWVGPFDAMPTIAAELAGRRGVRLVVPPHGSLCLRAMRGDTPVRVHLGSVSLHQKDEYDWLLSYAANGAPEGFGIEVPFVAVGAALEAMLNLPDATMLSLTGPSRAGETKAIDVVVPWRPEVKGNLQAPPGAPSSLRSRFATDAGPVDAFATRDPTDAFRIASPTFRAARASRVDFDVFVPGDDATLPQAWVATIAREIDLTTPIVDLGDVRFTKAPTLHGRVVDDEGNALADIDVIAGPAGTREDHYVLRTDANGRFVWAMALPRANDGSLLPLTAMARHGELRSATAGMPDDGSDLVLRLTETSPASPGRRTVNAGEIVATIVDARPADQGQRWLLRAASGFGATSPTVTRSPGGNLEVHFENLPGGFYTLCISDPHFVTRIVRSGLMVPGDGPCTDPRLQRISMHEEPRVITVRIVDAKQHVPIAGVRATVPGTMLTSDANGLLRIATHDDRPLPAMLEGSGLRALDVADLGDGTDIVMRPASTFRVHIDLPADLARDRFEVWVRHEQRERFLGPRGTLDANGDVDLATPIAGRYFVNLLVAPADPQRAGSRRLAAVGPDAVVIGDSTVAPISWRLDDAEVARLRELLQAK